MSIENPTQKEKEFFQIQEDNFQWKPCPLCGAEITQVRKASFQCINCKQNFIADEALCIKSE